MRVYETYVLEKSKPLLRWEDLEGFENPFAVVIALQVFEAYARGSKKVGEKHLAAAYKLLLSELRKSRKKNLSRS